MSQDDIEGFITGNVTDSWEGERRIFLCLLCNKSCGTRRDVGRHIESFHVITEPFKCQLCDNEFSTRRALKRHINNYHTVK